jgi:hypothetical protein
VNALLPLPLLLALALSASPELKRAKDRCEFGAWADCAGTLRPFLARDPALSDAEAVEAWRMLGVAEYHLGDRAAARSAFVSLLSVDPDFSLDPFLVPPPIVDFFDKVKRETEPDLAPLRARKREVREQQRLAEEARRRLLAEEQARNGPPSKVVKIQERIYLLNWMPFGIGQFQNGHKNRGTAIAAGQLTLALVNVAAILAHSQVADDRSRMCTSSQANCTSPPYTRSDRNLLNQLSAVKYLSAGLFWGLYGYGVWDAHRHFVPMIETEVGPGGQPATLKVGVQGSF